MVLTLMIPVRTFYGLDDIITIRHLNNMAKVALATGMIVAYGYSMEAFFAYFSADKFEVHDVEPHDGSLCACSTGA